MSTAGSEPTGGQPTEEELRAAYEAELKKIRVEHVLLEQIVTMINLGMRRTGLAPGTESERDPEQVRLAVEGVRVLLPLVEQAAPEQAAPIRDALSQLQLAFVRIGGQAPGSQEPAEPSGEAPSSASGGGTEPQPPPSSTSGEPGPAQRSGRLWIPGQ
jgi:hypothetical protein